MKFFRFLPLLIAIGALIATEFLASGAVFASPPETHWVLVARGEDFELFQKPSRGSSDLVAFRAIGKLKFTPLEVVTAILDREHRLQWMRDIKELKPVGFPGPNSVIEYSAVKTPFIIKDRDFVIRTDVEVDALKNRIVIVSKSVRDEAAPLTSYVRGELIEGRFIIEPGAEPGTTILTADMDVDPRGSIPRWIVNHFQKNWPIAMLRSLKNFLKRKVAKLPPNFEPLFKDMKQ